MFDSSCRRDADERAIFLHSFFYIQSYFKVNKFYLWEIVGDIRAVFFFSFTPFYLAGVQYMSWRRSLQFYLMCKVVLIKRLLLDIAYDYLDSWEFVWDENATISAVLDVLFIFESMIMVMFEVVFQLDRVWYHNKLRCLGFNIRSPIKDWNVLWSF